MKLILEGVIKSIIKEIYVKKRSDFERFPYYQKKNGEKLKAAIEARPTAIRAAPKKK
ncbi:hypothetical protein QO000_003896 [Alkalihalobacillus hemicentroti]|uniref:Cyclic lactone autoinducer peptide n=1 Tax=Guptibacillus hwajinpoensis TaxID=208199 RepID=A0ABU0K6A3_9BACL|nr:hypothetical protein [Alkalihalobacillus hemicentroti]